MVCNTQYFSLLLTCSTYFNSLLCIVGTIYFFLCILLSTFVILSTQASTFQIKHFQSPHIFLAEGLNLDSRKLFILEDFRGITVDHKLLWKRHFQETVSKATMICRSLTGNTWGCNPSILRWTYTTMIRLIITYMGRLLGAIKPDKVLLGLPLAKYKAQQDVYS